MAKQSQQTKSSSGRLRGKLALSKKAGSNISQKYCGPITPRHSLLQVSHPSQWFMVQMQ
ncbi:hypothetical protein A2U01_0114854 [Trifolium medium]|uniref:Uncharacterized protein n=1 Tax=Trifolium medium TaxID=97028 RepID=A0A392VZD0_9FABA|nr:hypothetical protein [Trifolium medium]